MKPHSAALGLYRKAHFSQIVADGRRLPMVRSG
jgi:hypothetical protein